MVTLFVLSSRGIYLELTQRQKGPSDPSAQGLTFDKREIKKLAH